MGGRRGVRGRKATGSIKRRLRKVERAVRDTTQEIAMKQVYAATNISSYYSQFSLTDYTQMAPTFGISANDLQEKAKCFHRKTGIDIILSMANEKDTVTHTIFLVSPKAKMFPHISQANGELTLVADLHFSYLDGMVMLNKDYFNIHKIKRVGTGNHGYQIGALINNAGVYPTNSDDTRIRHRFYMKAVINANVYNANGDWQDLPCNPVISRNQYLLFFNDNSIGDFESPTVTINMIHTLKQVI